MEPGANHTCATTVVAFLHMLGCLCHETYGSQTRRGAQRYPSSHVSESGSTDLVDFVNSQKDIGDNALTDQGRNFDRHESTRDRKDVEGHWKGQTN